MRRLFCLLGMIWILFSSLLQAQPFLERSHSRYLKKVNLKSQLIVNGMIDVDDGENLSKRDQKEGEIETHTEAGWKVIIAGHKRILLNQPENPFVIPFPPKIDVDYQDYLHIQEQLRAINIHPLISKLYPDNLGYTSLQDFLGRCSRGISQTLIDEEKGYCPTQGLIKIGAGGDNCFVCCVPYDGVRDVLLDKTIKTLETTGFNGYFYYRKGGFPNPTGKEIQYVGVPYCFKIFMMLEASNQGFKKVIWLDSACLPLRDPVDLFDWLDHHGALLCGWTSHLSTWQYILPSTWQLLKDLTGNDVLRGSYVHTRIFGLKMDHEQVKKLIEEYYRCVELGTPFLSCYPEEFVLSALLGKPDYACWGLYPHELIRAAEEGDEFPAITHQARDLGYYFYQMRH